VVEGASPAVFSSQFFCAEGSKCLCVLIGFKTLIDLY
jgi:hypothetical protein